MRHTKVWNDLNCPQLFRYMEEKYIDNFFENGELRITTLNECRKHEEIRQDIFEGVLDFIHVTTDDEGKVKVPEGMLYILDEQDNPISNAKALLVKQLRNCYLLCMSSNDRLFQKFQCKYAIKIYESKKFYQDVSAVIEDIMEVRIARFGSVFYANDRSKVDLEQRAWDAVFVKNKEFSLECEWRACIIPKGSLNQIQPLNICCPHARRWCEKISLEQTR